MSDRVSGLSDERAAHARELISKAARIMASPGARAGIHYSQRGDRWEGIRSGLSITRSRYPKHSDCSSCATWMLWDAIHRSYGVRDIVNHCGWSAGFTGTMYKSGKAVVHDANHKIGDLIFYGDQGGGVPKHVTVYVGGGKCFSHGSEAGPFILDIDYRNDRRMTRRFI